MQKKLLLLLLITSSLSLQANYFARASRMFQVAKQQVMNWSKNKFNANWFASDLSQPMQPQRSQLASTLPRLQACAQVQPTWFSRFNMFARRFAGQRHEDYQRSNYEHQESNYHGAPRLRPALGAGIFGALWGLSAEFDDADKMEEALLQADDETKQEIIQTICDNPIKFAFYPSRHAVVKKLCMYMPQAAYMIAQSIMNPHAHRACGCAAPSQFLDIINATHGYDFLIMLIEQDAQCIDVFLPEVKEQIASLVKNKKGRNLIAYIAQVNAQANEQLEKIFEEVLGHSSLKDLVCEQTQTTQHFKYLLNTNMNRVDEFLPKDQKDKELFEAMIKDVVEIEKQEQEAGRYTFVHGSPWEYDLYRDLYTQLWSITCGDVIDDYQFLRFITDLHEESGQAHQEMRERLINEGTGDHYRKKKDLRKYLLFMNYGLLVNEPRANSLYYILKQCSGLNRNKIPFDKIFSRFGLDAQSYKEELKELEELHKASNKKRGAGIIISASRELVKKSVYLSGPGGVKRSVYILGIGQTDDVQLILDTLRSAPEKMSDIDRLEFVHVLTKDCALNLEVIKSGAIKIIPFNPADPEKLALYKEKLQQLMAKIKADVFKQRQNMCADEIQARQHDLQAMQLWYKQYNCLNDDCGSRLQEA